jgi:hypothetical protein
MPRNVTVTFNDGATHVYEGVPDNATPDQVEARASQEFGKQVTALDGGGTQAPAPPPVDHQARLQAINAEIEQTKPSKLGTLRQIADGVREFRNSADENALNLASGAIATPIAGLAGLATAPLGFIPGMEGVGARNVERVQNALTYQPQSEVAKDAQANIAKPLEKFASWADQAGQAASDATGSPAIGAAVNTGVQALPAIITRRGGPLSRVSIGKGGITVAPAATAPAAAAGSAAAAAEKSAANHVRNLGFNWDTLAQETKAKLTTIAQEAGDLSALDDAALSRELRLNSLPAPVPATRGQITRDPVALRNEGNVAATAAGAPIQDIHVAQNQALLDNLDILKGKVAGTGKTAATATTPEQVGAAVQGAARGKLEFQRAKVKALYDKADAAGETLQPVPPEGMKGVLAAVGDTVDQPHFSYANSWLKANAEKINGGQVTIRDMEKLRKQAAAKAMNGGEDAHYAGQLIQAIDAATEGAGGALYQESRAARFAQGNEFEQQGAVAELVGDASRTDRTTALENTTKAITTGSLEDIRKVKRTLLTGGDEATRTAGKQAWREVRAQVVQGIKDEATKGVALNADGSPNLTAAGLKRAIDRYGPAKLDEVFGPGTAKQLNNVLEAARDVKTQPPNQIAGSSTVANALAFLEKGLTKIPGGGLVADVARGVASIKESGASARKAQAATTTPLSEFADKAARKGNRRNTIGTAKQIDPALVPLSQVGERRR